jgi:hypothetical protein
MRIASFAASKLLRHERACFFQITVHSFKYTSVRLSLMRISMLIFPQCKEKNFIAKKKRHGMSAYSALVNPGIFVVATVVVTVTTVRV